MCMGCRNNRNEELWKIIKVLPQRIYRRCDGRHFFVLCLASSKNGYKEYVIYQAIDEVAEIHSMPLKEFTQEVLPDLATNTTKQARLFELADLSGDMLNTVPTESLVMELCCRGDRPEVVADLPEKLAGLKMHDDYVLGRYLSEGEINEDIFVVGPNHDTLQDALHESKRINDKSGRSLKIFRRVYIPVEG